MFLFKQSMYQIIDLYKNTEKYVFNPFLGLLYTVSGYENQKDYLGLDEKCPYKNLILNPFLLQKRAVDRIPTITAFAKIYAKLLVFLCKYCYPIAYLLSFCRLNLYANAGEANMAFRNIIRNKPQKILCLSRSIFIATTSAKFKESGAMFIGCFFPSRHMHAWIVEEGMHADVYDYYWIMYTPVAMMK